MNRLKFLILSISAFTLVNCTKVQLASPEAVTQASQSPTTGSISQPTTDNACVPNAGQACNKQHLAIFPGCRTGTLCSQTLEVYYNSPNGCDANTAGSFVQFNWDGKFNEQRYKNLDGQENLNWTPYDDGPSRCTYWGLASISTNVTMDGQCHQYDTGMYVRVTAGTACFYRDWVTDGQGVTQCDGTCQ